VKPFHDTDDRNTGGPHGATNATADVNGRAMNGFVGQAEQGKKGCTDPNNPACSTGTATTDVMGYHDGSDIPNYWSYAKNFVLQDHMFEPNASWSLPAHLLLVSEWSAYCTQHDNPSSCTNALQSPGLPPDFRAGRKVAAQPAGPPMWSANTRPGWSARGSRTRRT
jgi:phospholipase C